MNKISIDKVVTQVHTIQDILQWTINQFNIANIYYGHGTDNCCDEALKLILPSLYLPLNISQQLLFSCLTLSERYRIINLVLRRINDRIPVAYLTNKSWFCGHEFYVDERVLIPRSPIGELINKHFSGIINYDPENILDMCTGSGCFAIACAYEFHKARIYAVDICTDALAVTKINIINHGFINRIIPIHSDLFLNTPHIKYDLMIINPPYVNIEDMADLPAEYMAEPKIALEGGSDGLKVIKRILANALPFLTKRGILICEVGNSMLYLIKEYSDVPFIWLEFEYGGDGVFMLAYKDLMKYQDKFKLFFDSY